MSAPKAWGGRAADLHHALEGCRIAADESVDALVTGGARPSAYRELFRSRNYRLWFISSLVSSLGDWTGFFALQALVVRLSGSAGRAGLFALGGVMLARLLPSLLIGPVAGVLADRYDRKRLMVFTDLVRGGLFVAVAVSSDLAALFALTFLVECLSLLYIAAKDASLPLVVERRHLTEGNQLNLLLAYGTLPLGAVLAAAIAGVLGLFGVRTETLTRVAILVNAVSFLLAAAVIARLRLPERGRPSEEVRAPGLVDEFREGLRFIRDLPLVRALVLGSVGVFFGAGVVVGLGPAFVTSEFGRPEQDWFVLATCVGVGLVAGIALVPVLTRRVHKERLFPVFMASTGAIAVVIALLPSFVWVLPFGFVLGMTAGLSFVMGYTLLHEHTRDEIRARTFAAFSTGTRVALFAALALAPFVAGTIGFITLSTSGRVVSASGVRITVLAGGLVALVSAMSAGRGMLRSLRDEPAHQFQLGAERQPRAGGVFIALEGVEGAGKSTQVRKLAESLRTEGREVVVTREPGGAPLAERVRALLLDATAGSMHARTEALLYAAARAQHVEEVIMPALAAGKVVLCDRFLHSSLAYQGFARRLGETDVFEINRWATGGLLPDAVVLLHLSPEEGLRRTRARPAPGEAGGDRGDRIEQESLDFHRRVAEGYEELARRDRGRVIVVDAEAGVDTVARRVRMGLAPWLPLASPAGGRRQAGAREPSPQ
jgi:dTMP kinase